MHEEIYSQVRDHSFFIALKLLHDVDKAEDVAQDVSIKYLMKENGVNKPLNWCSVVTRNECYSLSKVKMNKEILLSEEEIDSIVARSKKAMEESVKYANIPGKIAKKLLSGEDHTLYLSYVRNKTNIRKFAAENDLSYHSATTKIYRMKRNLKSAYLLSQGYRASPEIIDYNTNKNIIKFIRIFVKKMQENDLESLHKYFENFDVKSIPKLDIEKTFNYEIRITGEHEFKCMIPYKNSKNEIKFSTFYFYLNNRHRIKITKFIAQPIKVTKYKMTLKEALKKLPDAVKGIIPLNYDETTKILGD